jgi:hypothetical protein
MGNNQGSKEKEMFNDQYSREEEMLNIQCSIFNFQGMTDVPCSRIRNSKWDINSLII